MTNDIKPSNGKYKQIYYENSRLPYTSASVGHDDYVQTDVWKKLRDKRLKIDHYRCQHCGTAYNVQVHHLRYPTVWGTESVEDDLITLCAECHAETHKNDIAKEKNWND